MNPAKNTICLWYDGDAEEAAQFYAKTFPDSSVGAVCRAGSRSAQATAILQKAGFTEFANLTGGMLRWRAEGRAVDGGAA